jgi:hypothetical protein
MAATSVGSHAQTGIGSVESHPQTGSVHLHVVSAGFIVSTGSGTGTLSYQGREYPLSVGNVSFGTIGIAGAELVGTVYNLRTAADIAGTYTSVGAGLTVGAHVICLHLRDQEYMIALASNHAANQLLSVAIAVCFRGVDQRHPERKTRAQRLFFFSCRMSFLSEMPRALTQCGDDGAVAKLYCPLGAR